MGRGATSGCVTTDCGSTVTERDARVTLQQGARVRLAHAQVSWVDTDVENELSVLGNGRFLGFGSSRILETEFTYTVTYF